jgi:hypothetical protein
VGKVEDHIRRIAHNVDILRQGMQQLTDSEIIHLAYVTNTPLPERLISGEPLRNAVIQRAEEKEFSLFLAGELVRRYPRLVGL